MSGDLRLRLLKASLLHVNRSGFTQSSINNACQMLSLPAASSRILEHGPLELVHNVLDTAYERAYAAIDEDKSDSMTQNLKTGLSAYIDEIGLYNTHWDEAMYILAKPSQAADSLSRLDDFTTGLAYRAGAQDLNVS